MTPTEEFTQRYNRVERVTDGLGRSIGVKKLRPLMQATAIDYAGGSPTSMVANLFLAAAAVCEIDGEPVPAPRKREDLELVLQMLDDEGLVAVQEALERLVPASREKVIEKAKN